MKYLIFMIDSVSYGIEIEYVTEIIEIQPITQVPNTLPYIKGIINIRGTIVPVIDMRQRFSMEQAEYDERTCIVSLNRNNVYLGLIVDEVEDVIQLPAEAILPPPTENMETENKFLKSIGKYADTVKLIIDVDKLYEAE